MIDIVVEVVGTGGAQARGVHKYLVRRRSGSFKPLEFGWTDELRQDLEEVRKETPDRVRLAAIGERLAPFIADEAGRILAAPAGEPVRISIQLQSVSPEIGALPWELIPLGEEMRTLGSLPDVLLRYEVAGAATVCAQPQPPLAGGRILFAYSTAGGAVPQRAQCESILRACTAGHVEFTRDDVVTNAPLPTLVERLVAAIGEGRPYTVLHLLCHGGRLAAADDVHGLLWTDTRGEPVVLDPAVLADTLGPFAHHGLRLVVVSACLGGEPGTPGNPMRSVAERLHRAGIESVVASRFRLSVDGAKLFAQVFYDALLAGPASVESAFCAARNRLFTTHAATTQDHVAIQLWGRRGDGWDTRPIVFAPYRGLPPFERRHARFFFGRTGKDRGGRDREVDELLREFLALVASGRPRFMLVAGDSGTGKSSMIFAGALPVLERRGWTWRSMRPGDAPIQALERALADDAGASGPRILVIDQFEEVFTSAGADERQEFARRLWALACAAPERGWSVLLTMRIDFLGRCGELVLERASGLRLDRVACNGDHQVLVAQMDAEQLREAIEGPARTVGLVLAAGLTERILDDVDREPGALPLVQHTLSLLWQRRDGRTLTQAAYDELGGVAGALNRHADSVMARFAVRGDGHTRLARRLLTRLVHLSRGDVTDVGQRRPISELRPDGPDAPVFDEVLGELVDQRLLVCSGDDGVRSVEVAHEALIRKWERFTRWLDEARGKLLELAELNDWTELHRRHGTLLTAGQLAQAEALVAEDPTLVHAEARALVERSRSEAQRVVAQARRFRDTLRVTLAREHVEHDPGVSVALLREVEASDVLRVPSWLDCMAEVMRQPVLVRTMFTGHRGQPRPAALSPDGTRVVTTAEGEPTLVWSAAAGEVLTTLPTAAQATWSADGRWIATVTDTAVEVWLAETGERVASFAGHKKAAWGPGAAGLALGGAGVDVWDPVTGRQRTIVPLDERKYGHEFLLWSPDGARLLLGNTLSWSHAWDVAERRHVAVIDDNQRVARGFAWSPDSTRVAVASSDRSARVWDAATGHLLAQLEGHTDQLSAVAWSPDGTELVTCSWDRTARIWKSAGGSARAVLRGHEGKLTAAVWSLDGERIVTVAEDRNVRLWHAATGAPHGLLRGHEGAIGSIQWDRAGGQFVTTAADRSVRVWRARPSPAVVELTDHDGPISAAAWDGACTRVVTTWFAEARVWSAVTGAAKATLRGHTALIYCAVWSPDGAWLVTGGEDGTARVWSATTGATRLVLRGHRGAVKRAAWSPDGARIATAAHDGSLRIWDGTTGECIVSLQSHDYLLAWDRTATGVVAVGEGGREVRVWDARTGRLSACEKLEHSVWTCAGARAMQTPKNLDVRSWREVVGGLSSHARTSGVAWSADGRRLAEARSHADGFKAKVMSLQVWDIATASEVTQLVGHEAEVHAMAWRPDAALLATGSADHTIRVWDPTTGEALAVLRGHTDLVTQVAWSRDGDRLLSASSDGTARVWLLSAAGLRDHLWRASNVCLSVGQRQRLLDEDNITAAANAAAALRERDG